MFDKSLALDSLANIEDALKMITFVKKLSDITCSDGSQNQ